jgi:ribonuclease HII
MDPPERNFYNSEIDDSKKLLPAKREKLYALITNIALSYSFGITAMMREGYGQNLYW